ncbi:MucBP domain-containing protein, partial [Streptococcus sp. NLN76]|uniref:MucBP domain-containing protein n=1 Tax=Streptococcus sp. NLN76 TaxID=2822800 RepID=UPI0018AB5D15
MKKRKGFDWYSSRQRFSLRKYHFGLASVFLGALLSVGSEVAQAAEQENSKEGTETSIAGTEASGEDALPDPLLTAPAQPVTEASSTSLTVTEVEVQPEISTATVTEAKAEAPVVEEKQTDAENVADKKVEEKSTDATVAQNDKEASVETDTSVTPASASTSSAVVANTPTEPADRVHASTEEHEAVLSDEGIEEVISNLLTGERLKNMSPRDIAQLGVYSFGNFRMTQELFSQLTEEQIRALTFNRNYQKYINANKGSTSAFRANETNANDQPRDGYTVTESSPENYPKDPDTNRKTYTVIYNTESKDYYVFSVEKPTIPDGELSAIPDTAYISVFNESGTQIGRTVPIKLTQNAQVRDFENRPTSPVFTASDKDILADTANHSLLRRVYSYLPTNDPNATYNSINMTLPKYTKQVTKYLWIKDRTTPVANEYIQEGWEGDPYTTQPIEIPGYTYVESSAPANQDGRLGNTNTSYLKGDIQYVRAVTTARSGGSNITVYQKREYIDNQGTYKLTVYMLPKDANTHEAPSVREFFQNMGNYTVYEDKIHNLDGKLSDEVVNSNSYLSNNKDAFYRLRENVANSGTTFEAFLALPDNPTSRTGDASGSRFRYPVAETATTVSGNLTIRNRWTLSSNVNYYYEKTGNVYVTYKDTDGNTLKVPDGDQLVEQVTDTKNGELDSNYDTGDHKPNTIKTEEGKTFKLAPAGNYPVGEVDNNNHLTSSAPASGQVKEEDQTVTYIYQEVKGDVVVLYRTKDGTPITGTSSDGKTIGSVTDTETEEKRAWEGAVVDTTATSTGTDYTTTDNRPEKITTADGKVYKRIDEVAGTENGKVVEGTTRIVYYYELQKGSVLVDYVDTEGNTLQAQVIDVNQEDTGTDYDTKVDNRPATITAADGKVYELVPAGSYPVGTVGEDSNLTTLAQTDKDLGTDAVTGKVAEETKKITYVYKLKEEPKGDVVVNYVDKNGTPIKDPVKDVEDGEVDSDYNTDDKKDETITTEDGKKYKLVPAGDYPVGKVDSNSHLESSDPVSGKVTEETKEVTYVYQQVGGEVNARYVIEGTEDELKDPTVVKPEDSPIGEAYQGTKPAEIEKDGKTYVLSTTKPVRSNEGDAPETGEVKEGKQTIVYQYVLKEEPKGNVIVHYKDTDGNT